MRKHDYCLGNHFCNVQGISLSHTRFCFRAIITRKLQSCPLSFSKHFLLSKLFLKQYFNQADDKNLQIHYMKQILSAFQPYQLRLNCRSSMLSKTILHPSALLRGIVWFLRSPWPIINFNHAPHSGQYMYTNLHHRCSCSGFITDDIE